MNNSCHRCIIHNDFIKNSCVHARHGKGCKRTCLKGQHSISDMKGS